MNKQEAIEIVESRAFNIGDIDLACGLSYTKHIINQIDEPQKVVVPKFVAEWIDDSRKCGFDFDEWFDWNNQPKAVQLWLNQENKRQAELNALALVTFIVNGANAVEIEKEKLYTVEIPNPNRTTEPIIYLSRDERGKIFLTSWFLLVGQNWKKHPHSHLTESEIKEDFEWAWDAGFAKEVEEK